MAKYECILGGHVYAFSSLKEVMAKATPPRSGDMLAGVAASSDVERVAAQMVLADLPLKQFLEEPLIAPEKDEVSRLIFEQFDQEVFQPISHMTVGDFRNWLLSDAATPEILKSLSSVLMPEMAAAVSKLMRNRDLISVARKIEVITAFRTTLGLPGRISSRLQPNHPADDLSGIAASTLDGLLYGVGDAVIGVNPATDNIPTAARLLDMLDDFRERYEIPTQTCVLTHVTNTMDLIKEAAPVDLVFQSVAGSEAANDGFGVNLAQLREAYEATLSLKRGTKGQNVFYLETGQGSALSADAHHDVDQQTMEARAYAVARMVDPLIVNTVVGFIGPEYLYDGKEIIRAGLEDHFCGKLLGLPMGVDVCYTNHAESDQNDMDNLMTLLAAAHVHFLIAVPGADDIMLNYQSLSYHDMAYLRNDLGYLCAPEFEEWLQKIGLVSEAGHLLENPASGLKLLEAAS